MVWEITVQQLAERLTTGAMIYLLDVRQSWEHEFVALPDSQLIPLDQLPCRLNEVRPPPDVPVVVYCHHGIRSRVAAALLQQHGFAHVASLAGGLDAWALLVDPRMPRY